MQKTETLLKPIGGNGMHIKQETIIDEKLCRTPSPHVHSTTRTVKCEATSTSAQKTMPKCEIRNEALVKLEKVQETSRPTTFSIDMTSKEIIDLVQ